MRVEGDGGEVAAFNSLSLSPASKALNVDERKVKLTVGTIIASSIN